MKCAWDKLMDILPPKLRREAQRRKEDPVEEIRLRAGLPGEILSGGRFLTLPGRVEQEDLQFVVNTASRYSPWAAETVRQGYLSGPGGHRIGLCGECICREGRMEGIREVQSLCIRVARDLPGLAQGIPARGSTLILGAPGWGKTTLLRDLIRKFSERTSVGVVDQRGELFPPGFDRGKHTDVLTGCSKGQGLEILLRTMGPGCIALDEITAAEDCQALLEAANCGVTLLATAHGTSLGDFQSRKTYAPLVTQGVFDQIVVLRPDRGFSRERMGQ